ncbi:MAG: hypothetical protein IKY22_04520 [Bacteroidales bacterium]|nr:hypothetical protein [Bacteroidales bacterium]
MKKIFFILLFSALSQVLYSQKIIEYQSGMGTKDTNNANVWILYNKVIATHEGMNLYADSAHYDNSLNNFTAFRNIKIELTDTTTIYGDKLFYNGNTRIVEIWGKKVIFIDGETCLVTTHLIYNRNTNTASYDSKGTTTNKDNTMISMNGLYYSDLKEFLVYDSVKLFDSSSMVVTDTLRYNTNTNIALFKSPTYIYSDSTVIYSEYGWYNTNTKIAHSNKNTKVSSGSQLLMSDTLNYNESRKITIANSNVTISDSVNDFICKGNYAYSDELKHYLFMTKRATAIFVDNADSLYMHSDTIFATTNNANEFESVKAYHHVKFYRKDIQGSCDSVFYNVPDSIITMFYDPVIWNDDNQFTADTIVIKLDSTGVKQIFLNGNVFISQRVDATKYNQINGKNAIVYLDGKNPLYCDILGNAQSIFYLTEEQEDGTNALLGVNVGIGSGMRIYFNENREPTRIVTHTNPDMTTYPIKDFPEEKKTLKGFKWCQDRRPLHVNDIYIHYNMKK